MSGCTTLSPPKPRATACSMNEPEHRCEADVPDGAMQYVADQFQAVALGIRSRLDAQSLEDRGQCVAERRTHRERDRHHGLCLPDREGKFSDLGALAHRARPRQRPAEPRRGVRSRARPAPRTRATRRRSSGGRSSRSPEREHRLLCRVGRGRSSQDDAPEASSDVPTSGVEASDELLARITALRETHGVLHEVARFLGNRLFSELAAHGRDAGLDASRLKRSRVSFRGIEVDPAGGPGRSEHVEAGVAGPGEWKRCDPWVVEGRHGAQTADLPGTDAGASPGSTQSQVRGLSDNGRSRARAPPSRAGGTGGAARARPLLGPIRCRATRRPRRAARGGSTRPPCPAVRARGSRPTRPA